MQELNSCEGNCTQASGSGRLNWCNSTAARQRYNLDKVKLNETAKQVEVGLVNEAASQPGKLKGIRVNEAARQRDQLKELKSIWLQGS